MSFIPLDLTGAVESKPVPAGRYDLVITGIPEEVKTKEKGKPQLAVSIAINGHDTAPNVRHYLGLPAPDDEPKSRDFKILLLRRFCELFAIPFTAQGFDLNDFAGASASSVEVSLSEPTDSGDVYNRLVIPRMRGEGEATGRVAPKPPKV